MLKTHDMKSGQLKNVILLYSSLLFINQFVYLIEFCIKYKKEITSYPISDWLINYQGGFVRRGLIGEVLYYLYDITSVNVVLLIIIASFLIMVVFSCLFINKWRQYKLSYLILPTFLLIGGLWGSSLYLGLRRDIIIFLMAWGIFLAYKKILDGKKQYHILMQLLIVLMILSHEASIFYVVPIILIHYGLIVSRKNSRIISFGKACVLGIPSIITFYFCSCFKGKQNVANQIWNSWSPYFESLDLHNVQLGKGPWSLTWTIDYAFSYHTETNFFTFEFGMPSLLLWPIVFFVILYLLVNINRINFVNNANKSPFSVIKFIHILGLQYVFLLPMFTVLSCDYKRVIQYWVISSFLFYFSLSSKDLTVFYNRKISYKLKDTCLLFNRGLLSNKTVYIIILLISGIPECVFSFKEIFQSSIIGMPLGIAYHLARSLGLLSI